MADDQAVADLKDTADVEDGFNAAVAEAKTPAPVADTKAKPEEKPKADKPVAVKPDPADGDKTTDAPEKGVKPKGDTPPAPKAEGKDEKTAAERMAERAAEIEAAAPVKEQAPLPKPEAPAPAPAKTEAPPAPKADAAAPEPIVEAVLSEKELGDIKVKINGEDMTIAQAREMLPEMVDINMAIANAILKKLGGKPAAAPGADGDPVAALTQRVESLQVELANRTFFDNVIGGFVKADGTVVVGHSDARQIARSPEFRAWLDTQSAGVKAMARSLDPEDGVTLLDAYKETRVKAVAREPTKKHERRVDQLRESTPGQATGQKAATEDDEAGAKDEKEAGFNAALKK